MTKPGLLPVMIVMLGFVDGGPNLQNNVSLLSENTITNYHRSKPKWPLSSKHVQDNL